MYYIGASQNKEKGGGGELQQNRASSTVPKEQLQYRHSCLKKHKGIVMTHKEGEGL